MANQKVSEKTEMKTLLTYDFEFVENLQPVINKDGSIKKFYPQSSYIKKEGAELNNYGEGAFCKFSISSKWSGISGVYAYFIDDELDYIGQCVDFAKRFNMGYGNISPRCCFKGGQSTNCKINKVILEAVEFKKTVAIYFYKTPNYDAVEFELIRHFNPLYNTALTISIERTHKEKKALPKVVTANRRFSSQADIKEYILECLKIEKELGKKQVTLVSGDMHKALGLNSRMPSVCSAMYAVMCEKDTVLKTTPSGLSSTITIQYSLVDRF